MRMITGVETHGWVDEFDLAKSMESPQSPTWTTMEISTTHSATQTSIDFGSLAYGDAARVTKAVAVCGCQHD